MPRSANLEQVAATFEFDVAEFYELDEEQQPSQLDRIEDKLDAVLELLSPLATSEEVAKDVAAVVARTAEAAGSPRSPARGRPESPRAVGRRSGA